MAAVFDYPNQSASMSADPVLDADAEASLCELCYDIIVRFGMENVVKGVGRAARLRAADYTRSNRRLYLRHERASVRVLVAHNEILADSERIEEIVDEEQTVGSRWLQGEGTRY